MTTRTTDAWHLALPPDIIHRAYRTSNGELAWPQSDAMQIVSELQNKGYRVIGVDTWLPTRPGPSPLIRDWDETSMLSAVDFIKTFELLPSERSNLILEPYFNLTVT